MPLILTTRITIVEAYFLCTRFGDRRFAGAGRCVLQDLMSINKLSAKLAITSQHALRKILAGESPGILEVIVLHYLRSSDPRERPLTRSVATNILVTVPYCANRSRQSSSTVAKDRFPTNNFISTITMYPSHTAVPETPGFKSPLSKPHLTIHRAIN
jgi:hypothetical protein